MDIGSNDTLSVKNNVNGNRSDRSSSTSVLRRSHSQSNVNKPSQDLLGLSLHPITTETIDIDSPRTSNELQAKTETCHESDNNDFTIERDIQIDSGVTQDAHTQKLDTSDSSGFCNTSKGKNERLYFRHSFIVAIL